MFEIQHILVVSTAHITEEVAESLAQDELPIIVYSKDQYGFFIFVPEQFEHERDSRLPPCLQDIIELAKSQGTAWIMLDRDAEPSEALTQYSW